MKYEYVYAVEVFGDSNNNSSFGVQDYDTNNPGATYHVKWFPTIAKLEAYTRRFKLRVTNRKEFLKRFAGISKE